MAELILVIMVIYVTMVYGPIAAFLVEMFPTKIRYTSMSLPYHIGNGWFGGMLPLLATAVVAATGNIYAGLWYPIGVAVMTLDRRARCSCATPRASTSPPVRAWRSRRLKPKNPGGGLIGRPLRAPPLGARLPRAAGPAGGFFSCRGRAPSRFSCQYALFYRPRMCDLPSTLTAGAAAGQLTRLVSGKAKTL